MKTSFLLFLVQALGAPAAVTAADGAPQVVDHGERVVVVAPGLAPAAAGVHVLGDRIEIDVNPLPGALPAAVTVRSGDATVQKVELVTGDRAKLSLHIRHSQKTTIAIAALTRMRVRKDGFDLDLPRDPKHPGAESVEAETPSVAAAAAAAAVVPAANASPAPAANPTATQTPAAPAPSPDRDATSGPAAPAAATIAAAPIPPAAPVTAARTGSPATPVATAEGASLRGTAVLAGSLVLAAVVLIVLARRRRHASRPAPRIQVVGSQSLGGKTKVVLLAAGKSEMLLSVSDRGARLLARWHRRPEPRGAGADRPLADGYDDAGDAVPAHIDPETSRGRGASSPAVAGLLRLRRNTPATEEAAWARDLRKAFKNGSNGKARGGIS
jgi:flagellar biosynthesis protein FliO